MHDKKRILATVAVVILNWNGKKFLEQFLPGVLACTGSDARVIVADNASTDDSVAWLRKYFPEVKLIQNRVNGGFATGYNEALRQVEADYYVLLNSDIEVTPGWLRPVIELMEADKRIGACQPKIRSWHNRAKFEYAGAAGGFIDKYGYPFCRGRVFFSLEEDKGQYDDNVEIFWATGACMFVRAGLYHQLGGLDDDFFAHMEEIDFCWRLKLAGYKVMACGASEVYHVGGGTLPKNSPFKTYLNIRNNIVLLYKNLPSNRLLQVFLVRAVLDVVAAFHFLLSSGVDDFTAVFKAHYSFYKNLSKHRKKRNEITQVEVSEMYEGNIVVAHYIKQLKRYSELGKKKFRS